MSAALVSLAGMDPVKFLECEDNFQTLVMQLVSKAATEQEEIRDHNRAVMIAKEVSKLFGG